MLEAFSGGDPTLPLVIAVSILFFLVITTLSIAALVFVGPRMRLKRRLGAYGLIKRSSGGGDGGRGVNIRQRRIQEKLQEMEEEKAQKKSRRVQLRSDLLQAGLGISVRKYVIIISLVGLGTFVFMLVAGFGWFVALMGASVGALGIPNFVLKLMARGRQKQFTGHFANAIDVVVRGTKSGLPVGECLAIVGREAPHPVGEEFRRLVEGQKIGLSLGELMERGLERIPTSEYKFFSIVLMIQQRTGGNLSNTLESLSNVLRERKRMKDKVLAMSSEAKSSAGIIGSLPFFVAGMIALLNPDYMALLFTETLGNFLVAGGLIWMLIGVVVMSKMINFKM